jgi:hypothetical protein
MNKIALQYLGSAAFLICGLFSLFYAFAKRKNQIEKYQELIHPPPKNYGKAFLICFGLILLFLGVSLLFMKIK